MADQNDRLGADAADQPQELLNRDDLDYEEKLDTLQRWKADLRNDSAGEDQDKRLADVEEAIEQLQANVTVDPDKPKGAPSRKGYRPES